MKREAVLNAAAALFRRNGYNGASIADLAGMLNITKPTLYYYVGSKEELFAEIIARAQNDMLEAMRSAVALPSTGVEKLKAIMLAYAEINTSDFGACVILTRPSDLDPALAREMESKAREANGLIYAVLAEGVSDGTLKPLDPAIVLNTVFGALNWLPRWHKPAGRMSIRKIAETQIDMIIGGIRGPGAKPEPAPKRVRQKS